MYICVLCSSYVFDYLKLNPKMDRGYVLVWKKTFLMVFVGNFFLESEWVYIMSRTFVYNLEGVWGGRDEGYGVGVEKGGVGGWGGDNQCGMSLVELVFCPFTSDVIFSYVTNDDH